MKAAIRFGKARHGWPAGGRSSAVPQCRLRPYGSACGPANAWNSGGSSGCCSGTGTVLGLEAVVTGGAQKELEEEEKKNVARLEPRRTTT